MIHERRTATIDADLTSVWDVLAHFGDISRWAPNVDHSCLLADLPDTPGTADLTGIPRRIQAGRTVLVETVTAWSPPSGLTYRIEGLPPVLRSVSNEWQLTPAPGTPDRTVATLTSHVDAGPRPPQQLIARVAAKRLAGESEKLLHGLQLATRETNP